MSVTHTEATPLTAPMSATQTFLCMFDKGPEQGALGPRHLVVFAWRLTGRVDVPALRAALGDVVERHEALRTSLVREEGNEHQRINPPLPPRLEVRDLPDDGTRPREVLAEEFTNEIEAGRFSIHEQPLICATLGRFDDEDSVLALLVHHVACDGWSMQLIFRDLLGCYAARCGSAPYQPPEMRQYREYAEWQLAHLTDETTARNREFWREKLSGGRVLTVPTDRPLTSEPGVYSVHRFLIDRELTAATMALSRDLRSSPFMVLFAIFNVLLGGIGDETDIVLPTITAGRTEPEFAHTVGPFFNFLPVRTDLAGCETFRNAFDRVRKACFAVYAHELPFLYVVGEAPELFAPLATGDCACFAFQVFQFPADDGGASAGDLRYSEIRKRLRSEPETSDIPDGALWTLDLHPSGEMVGSLRFNSRLFDAGTIADMIAGYERLLRTAVVSPDAALPAPAGRSTTG
jgi:condensation enzyme